MTDWDEFEDDGRASYTEPVEEDEEEATPLRAPAAAAAVAVPERPMFILEKIPYQPKGLKCMVSQNGMLIMGTDKAHVLRVHQDHHQDLEDIPDLSKRDTDRIHAVYEDPTGGHVLISMATGDNYYLHESWKKPKPIPKMKDVVVSSIAWDATNTDKGNSGTILVGSSKGIIFEAVLDVNEKGTTKVWKVVYNIDTSQSIDGLVLERIGSSGRLLVMAATATRLYEFQSGGGGGVTGLFELYEARAPIFVELPGGVGNRAELQLLRTPEGLPKYFAWMADPGIYHGKLSLNGTLTETVIVNGSLMKFENRRRVPVAITLTELHFLCVYPDQFRAVRILDEQVVREEAINAKLGRLQGLTVDSRTGVIWVYSESALFVLGIVDEDRDMCALYLQRGQFEQAKQYAKTTEEKDQINARQADAYFEKGNFEQAAMYYGRTNRRFEEITLKFIDCPSRDALRIFLENKLGALTARDSTQKTMVSTWLVEIYLNRLNELAEAPEGDEAAREALKNTESDFRQLLDDHKKSLDYKTTINLISSHGRYKEMIHYATIMEDYERVINAFINNSDYQNALRWLQKQTNEELFYRFSPILMNHAPVHAVNSWMKAASFLKPRKLIPALMRYDPANNPENEPDNQAIRYLEFCVKKLRNTDEAIHNYLLSLYAQAQEEEKLLAFLSESNPHFDLKYGLRLCSQYKMDRAQVLIYGNMGLFEEAVEVALGLDLELAKVYADKPEDDDELRKRLWLRIAKHVVSEGKNIKKAMSLLENSVLKIEDLLPFFPEFTLIDSFKDEICSSLESYNKDIENLREQMDQSTQSADEIRQDIQKLAHKYGFVDAQQKCQLCETAVLTRDFYLFPCQHVYHADCLQQQMVQHFFDETQRQKYNTLGTQIRKLEYEARTTAAAAAASSASTQPGAPSFLQEARNKLTKLRAQLDELVAPECLLCGQTSIAYIDKPFMARDEQQEASSWTV